MSMKGYRIRSSSALLYGIILVLTQLLITQWTVRAAGSREVLDYISFAGTLTSMLLAVLAIVYSYYTTASQKNDADRIASQIGSLGSTIQTLNMSEARLSDELQRLSDIRTKLDELRVGVDRYDATASSLHGALERVIAEQQAIREASKNDALRDNRVVNEEVTEFSSEESGQAEPEIDTTSGIPEDVDCNAIFAEQLAKSATVEQCLFFLAAYRNISFVDESVRDTVESFIKPLIIPEKRTSFLLDSAYGEIFGYVMVFIDLGLTTERSVRDAFLNGLVENVKRMKPTAKRLPQYDLSKYLAFVKAEMSGFAKDIGTPVLIER